jgi:RHS repeat-associated protein
MLRLFIGAFLLFSFVSAEARNSRALPFRPVVLEETRAIEKEPIPVGSELRGETGLGTQPLGSKGTTTFGWMHPGGAVKAKYVLGPSTIVGASYKIVNDGCNGKTLTPGVSCTGTVSYSFTAAGVQNGVVTTPFAATDETVTPPITTSGTTKESYSAYVPVTPPAYEQNPGVGNCQGQSSGSIISVDGSVLGERIPIVGTDLSLNYTSANSAQYVSSEAKAQRIAYFNPEGMSVSGHYYYDRTKLRLFDGQGSSRFSKYVRSGDDFVVASSDAAELYFFDSTGKHITTRNALTGAVLKTFIYTSNKLTSIRDAYNNTTKFVRNSSGVLGSIVAPFGQTTLITATSSGLISTIKSPLSQTHTLAYKSGTELLEKFTKPGGQFATFTYDTNGKLKSDVGSAGNRWDFLISLLSDQRTVDQSSAMSRKDTYYYWAENGDTHRYVDYASTAWSDTVEHFNLGGSTFSEENYGESVLTKTDERLDILMDRPAAKSIVASDQETGNTQQVDYLYSRTVAGKTSLFNYQTITDAAQISDRVSSTSVFNKSTLTFTNKSFEGVTSKRVIDQYGKTVSNQFGGDLAWTYLYDSAGRLSQKFQGTSSNKKSYLYNTNGYLQSTTNALNEVTSYSYDLAGKLTQITLPDGRLIGMTYDVNGNKTGITPPSKPQHKFVFNAMELMSSYQPPALTGVTVKDTTYAYNQDKQLTQITRPDTQIVKYVYGANTGRLEQAQVARGADKYTYVEWSDRVSQIDSADGIRSVYKYFGKSLKSEEQRLVSNNALLASVEYLYDNEFRVSARVVKGSGYTSTVGITYNGDSVPTKIGNMTLAYSYPSGRLATTALDRITDSRTYDTLGNLKSYTAIYTPTSGAATTLYTYTLTRDVTSRISGKTETIGGVTSTYAYKYDVAGRLTSVTKDGATNSTFTYDTNGNKTGGSINGVAFTATYDNQDRIATWNSAAYSYNANGDNNGIQNGTAVSTFTYDAYSRILASVVSSSNYKYQYDGSGRQVRVYSGTTGLTAMRRIYENDLRIAAEYNDSGVVTKEYIYGTSVNSPEYVIMSGVRYRYIKDHLGSPRLLVKSTDGTIAQRMDYNILGQVTNNTKPGFQAYGFAGGHLISSVGLTKFGVRWYDANTGRWTSKDPIRFDGGDMNLYGYSINDPVNFIDYDGRNYGYTIAAAALVAGLLTNKLYREFEKDPEMFNKMRDIIRSKVSEGVRDVFGIPDPGYGENSNPVSPMVPDPNGGSRMPASDGSTPCPQR